MNVLAITVGVAIALVGSILMTALGMLMPVFSDAMPAVVISWIFRLLTLGTRLGAGFAAGWIAQRDGLLHGVVVGVIGSVFGLLLNYSTMFLRFGSTVFEHFNAGYWLQLVFWMAVGIALSAVGGLWAARLRSGGQSS